MVNIKLCQNKECVNSCFSNSLIYSINTKFAKINVGQGLAPAEKIRENAAGASPCPTIMFWFAL